MIETRRILVVGATGSVGRRLTAALVAAGHDVRAGTRRPDRYDGPGSAVFVDLDDGSSIHDAVADVDVVHYLVHSLDTPDFAAHDRARARRFVEAAAGRAERVVYLGGLGRRHRGSPHLRSRHEVGDILARGMPTVELRAGLVLGAGSASYELLRRTVDRLIRLPGPHVYPVPTALTARTQPIGADDAVVYLTAAGDLEPGTYDIGAPDVLRYTELLELQAEVVGERLRALPILPVPTRFVTPLAALIARQPPLTVHALFTSAGDDAVVEDDRIVDLTGHRPAPLEEVLRLALPRS